MKIYEYLTSYIKNTENKIMLFWGNHSKEISSEYYNKSLLGIEYFSPIPLNMCVCVVTHYNIRQCLDHLQTAEK